MTIYVSLDLETTGFSFVRNRIVEIGAVAYCDARRAEVGQLDIYVKLPGKHEKLPPKIAELTGISDETLASKGVSQEVAVRRLIAWLFCVRSQAQHDNGGTGGGGGEDGNWRGRQKIVWLGQNIHMFDFPFVFKAALDAGLQHLIAFDELMDFLPLTKRAKACGEIPNQKLGTLYAKATGGAPLEGAHNALVDARAAVTVLRSPWFRNLCSEETVQRARLPFSQVLETFYSRYYRLTKRRRMTSSPCPKCNRTFSKFFTHTHRVC